MMKIVDWFFNNWWGGVILATLVCTTSDIIVFGNKVEFANTYIEGIKLCEEKSKSQCLLMVVPVDKIKGVEE
jgi:hypothetical protein